MVVLVTLAEPGHPPPFGLAQDSRGVDGKAG